MLAACCRNGFARTGIKPLLTPGQFDWDGFRDLVGRHRIAGLAAAALRGQAPIPAPVEQWLHAEQGAVVRQAMMGIAESRRLKEAFREGGVDLLFLKGLPIGTLAYGNPLLKMSWDIDLLVRPADVGTAADRLAALGFRPLFPKTGGRGAIVRWHRQRRESVWSLDEKIFVELHTALSDNPHFLAWPPMEAPRTEVALTKGVTVPTLAGDHLLAYLAVHGGSSGWFRLKWLADFAALLAGRSIDGETLDAMKSLGTGRFAELAIALTDRIFGIDLDPRLRAVLASDGKVRRMVDRCLRLLLGGEPTNRAFGTAAIHALQFGADDGLAFKWSEARSQFRVAIANRRAS